MNPTRLRADAAGNRARIIAAARTAIADAGEVKLNAIARQAGVGQGTLYRHFPTREDLLAEVYREDVDELVAAAPPCSPSTSRSPRWPAGSTGWPSTRGSSAGFSPPSRRACRRPWPRTAWARSAKRSPCS